MKPNSSIPASAPLVPLVSPSGVTGTTLPTSPVKDTTVHPESCACAFCVASLFTPPTVVDGWTTDVDDAHLAATSPLESVGVTSKCIYCPNCGCLAGVSSHAAKDAKIKALEAALVRAIMCMEDIAKGVTLTGSNLETWAKTASVLIPREAESIRAALALPTA